MTGEKGLPSFQRCELALRLKPIIAARAKEAQVRTEENRVLQNSAKQERPIDTRAELAAVAGVSHDTLSRAEVIAEKAPDAVKQELRAGKTSTTGHSKHSIPSPEKQVWAVAWWRRKSELRQASDRERKLYRLVKSGFRGGIL